MFIINCKWDKIFMLRSKSVVGKAEDAIHGINVYPADEAIGFLSAYQLDSDLSSGSAVQRFNNCGQKKAFFKYSEWR